MNVVTAAWLLVALLGIISEYRRLSDSLATRAWLLEQSVNGQRRLVANYKVRNAYIRGAVSVANFVLGLVAVYLTVVDDAPRLIGLMIPIILIVGQGGITLTSWLEQRDDDELARLGRERKRRTADPH